MSKFAISRLAFCTVVGLASAPIVAHGSGTVSPVRSFQQHEYFEWVSNVRDNATSASAKAVDAAVPDPEPDPWATAAPDPEPDPWANARPDPEPDPWVFEPGNGTPKDDIVQPWLDYSELILRDEQGQPIDSYGYCVAIDGNTAVVGAPFAADANGVSTGAVFVYTRKSEGAPWIFHQRLSPTEENEYARFGADVAISGSTIVVGVPFHSVPAVKAGQDPYFYAGAVHVYAREKPKAGAWTIDATLTAPEQTLTSYSNFGQSVAVRGTIVVVGQPDWNDGIAFVYRRGLQILDHSSGAWGLEAVMESHDDDTANGDSFGFDVAIDDATVVVGAPYFRQAGVTVGAAFVWEAEGLQPFGVSWTQKAALFGPDAEHEGLFGHSVDVDDDTIAVGAPWGGAEEGGEVHLFERAAKGEWNDTQILVGNVVSRFGASVGVAADSLVVGAPEEMTAHVYHRDGGAGGLWHAQNQFAASLEVLTQAFGTSVAIDGDNILVGDPESYGDVVVLAGVPPLGIDPQQGAAFLFTTVP